MKTSSLKIIFLILLLPFGQIWGQQAPQVLQFENPSLPGYLIVEQMQGSVEISAHDSSTIHLNSSTMPKIEQANNTIKITADSSCQYLRINLPALTSVSIDIKQKGKTFIKGLKRLVEVKQGEGDILLKDIGGWVIAYTNRGNITGNFTEVIPNKAMSFVNFRGDIRLQFPENTAAEMEVINPEENAVQNTFAQNHSEITEGQDLNVNNSSGNINTLSETEKMAEKPKTKQTPTKEEKKAVGYISAKRHKFRTVKQNITLPTYYISTRQGKIFISKTPGTTK